MRNYVGPKECIVASAAFPFSSASSPCRAPARMPPLVDDRYTRGCKARQRAKELREKREERQAFLAEEAAHKQQEAEERRRREIERRMRPRTTADFEILYNELEAWRLQVSDCVRAQTRVLLTDEQRLGCAGKPVMLWGQ